MGDGINLRILRLGSGMGYNHECPCTWETERAGHRQRRRRRDDRGRHWNDVLWGGCRKGPQVKDTGSHWRVKETRKWRLLPKEPASLVPPAVKRLPTTRETGVQSLGQVKRLPTTRETGVQSLGREGLLEKEVATHSSILAGKSHGWRSLVGYSPWGRKESDTTKRLPFYFPQGTSPANTLLNF